MKTLTMPLTIAMVATLAACSSPGNMQSTRVTGAVDNSYVASSQPVSIGAPVRSGSGTVVALLDPYGPTANLSTQSVTMRMDDGSTQSFGVEGVQLGFFERIRIRQDGTIARSLPK